MEQETKTLHFNVTGEFVTSTARELMFIEHRPYAVVEEFLLSCMAGTDMPKDQLIRMAQDVLLGRAKFVGNTADGTYDYVSDNSESECTVFKILDKLQQENEKLKKEKKKITEQYLDLVDGLQDNTLENVKFKENKAILVDSPRWYGFAPRVTPKQIKTGSSLLDSFFEANETEDNYGWLEPDGTFHVIEWGEHEDFAYTIIKQNEWNKNYEESAIHNGGDFLVYKRGWILLHNPAHGLAAPTYDDKREMTKAQKEFLFDYYVKRHHEELANKYWN